MWKKGFTLIEVLAVIVILAILAVLVVPMISNTIENSKQNSAKVSAQNYIDAVNTAIAARQVNTETAIANDTYYISALEKIGIKVEVTSPTDGELTIENGNVTYYYVLVQNYKVKYENGAVTVEKNDGISISKPSILNSVIDKVVTSGNGLYKTADNTYIYRGSTVDNYIKFKDDNNIYRIIGFYDDAIKLVSTDITHNLAYDNINNRNTATSTYCVTASTSGCNYFATSSNYNGKTIANDSTIKVYLDNWYNSLDTNIKSKIIIHNFNNGTVTMNSDMTTALQEDAATTYNGYVALISFSDAVHSSLRNYLSFGTSVAINDSYLLKLADAKSQIWMMNSQPANTWDIWAINYGTGIGPRKASRTDQLTSKFYVVPSFYISINTYASGSGTVDNPFVIVK